MRSGEVRHPERSAAGKPLDGVRDMLVSGNPVKLSRVAEGPVASFPGLGEHTDAVLRETLALDDDTLARLRDEGVIG